MLAGSWIILAAKMHEIPWFLAHFNICREKRWQRGISPSLTYWNTFHGTATGSISGLVQIAGDLIGVFKFQGRLYHDETLHIRHVRLVIEKAENWWVPLLHLQLSYSAASLFVNVGSTTGWWDSKGPRRGHPGSIGCPIVQQGSQTHVYKNW
jgi:hypothetical protein